MLWLLQQLIIKDKQREGKTMINVLLEGVLSITDGPWACKLSENEPMPTIFIIQI